MTNAASTMTLAEARALRDAEARWSDTATTATTWEPPQPLAAPVAREPYPLHALPDVIRAAVEEVQGFIKAPLAMVACSALSALSAVAMTYIDVARAPLLSGPCGLYFLTLAESGERKSTCDGFFVKPIREWESMQGEAMRPEIDAHKSALATWEAKRSGLLDRIKNDTKTGKNTCDTEADLRELDGNKPTAPRVPKLIRGDDTPENLAWSLARDWPAAAVISSEAGLVLGAHGMGSDSVMRNLGLLNVLWDGATHSIGRRSSESFEVKGARMTIALQIQEAPFRKFMERVGDVARGSGFLARFLVSQPESTQGTRFYAESPDSWPALGRFNRRISDILETPAPLGDDGTLSPAMVQLSPEAKAAWVEFYNEIEANLIPGGALDTVRDVASKSADNVARMAALFSLFDNGGLGQISAEHLDRASTIVAWHLSESLRFLGEVSLPPEIEAATLLDKWLIEHCRREGVREVPTRDVTRLGPSRLRTKDAIESAVAILADHDRAKMVQDGKKRAIAINPALLMGAGK
ncbi:MAG TPA: YfjI family protein [Patescibacteria group bacterium]|nr:YfjI family protein [Patescibacteria group bacterium]